MKLFILIIIFIGGAMAISGLFSLTKLIVTKPKIPNQISINSGHVLTKSYEGYRARIYKDTKGNLTGGYGARFELGEEYPKEIWERMFDFEYWRSEQDYDKLNLNLDPIRKLVIIDLIFNMGLPSVQKFHKMLFALRQSNYSSAKFHLLDSKYAKDVPSRAIRNANILETGRLL